jgi:hypothetical protein
MCEKVVAPVQAVFPGLLAPRRGVTDQDIIAPVTVEPVVALVAVHDVHVIPAVMVRGAIVTPGALASF